MIARRGGIIKARNAIQSDTDVSKAITTDISNAIKEKHSGVSVKIGDHMDRIKGEISELEEDIEALNTLISAGEEQTSELKKGWENKVTNSVEEYYTLLATKEDITNLLNELKKEIDEQIDLQLAREAENIRINGTDFEEYGELNTLLDNAGCEKVDRESIEDAVRYVKKARKVQLTARDRQASLKEKVRVALPLMSGTIGGLRSDYRTLQNDIADSQVIDLPNWDEEFDPSVRSKYFVSRSSNLDDQMERSLDTIENHTKQILDTATDKRTDPDEFLSDGSHNRATQMLNHYNFDDKDTDGSVTTEGIASIATNVSSAQQLGQRIKDGSLEEALSDILVAPFEQRKDNKEAVLAEKRNTLDSYEVLKSIVKNEGQTYAERADNVPDSDEIANFPDVGTPGPFKMDVKPRDRGRLGGTETLADTNLWDREAEQAQLLEHLNTIMPELTGEHLPINKIGISHEDTAQPRYDGYRAASVFMSPMFEKYQEEDVAQIEDVTHSINDDVNIKESEYLAARGTFADAYDFAMTTFLTGVFLDNLQVFTDDCRDAYTRVTDVPPEDSDRHNHRDSVPKTVQHHTYSLDGMTYHTEGQFLPQQSDGGFCYREKLLNLDGEDVKVLLDQAGEPKMNTEQVVERLLEDYYEIVGYESTV